jgi:hypothetical protein
MALLLLILFGHKECVISCSVSWTNEHEDHRAKEFMHKLGSFAL